MARNKQRYQNHHRAGTQAGSTVADTTELQETAQTVSEVVEETTPPPAVFAQDTEFESIDPVEETPALEPNALSEFASVAVADAVSIDELMSETIDAAAEDFPLPQAVESVSGEAAVDLEVEALERERARAASVIGFDKDAILARMSLTARMSILGVIDYVARVKQYGPHMKVLMANEQFVTDKGPEEQAKLFRNIMDIITKTDDASFQDGMNFLMLLFQEHGDEGEPLSAANLYRFQENIPLRAVELQLYPNLMRVFTQLCDPTTRARDARAISFERAFQYGLSEEARNRLVNYFMR